MKRIIFDVPRWHVHLHRDARELETSRAEKDDPLQKFEDELFDRLYSGETERLPKKKQDAKLSAWANAVHQACDKLPAFSRLASECRGGSRRAGDPTTPCSISPALRGASSSRSTKTSASWFSSAAPGRATGSSSSGSRSRCRSRSPRLSRGRSRHVETGRGTSAWSKAGACGCGRSCRDQEDGTNGRLCHFRIYALCPREPPSVPRITGAEAVRFVDVIRRDAWQGEVSARSRTTPARSRPRRAADGPT